MFLREVCLGVCESFQVGDGETGREVEVEELLIEGMVRRDDRYGDSRPVAEQTQKVSAFVAVTQNGSDGETAGRKDR